MGIARANKKDEMMNNDSQQKSVLDASVRRSGLGKVGDLEWGTHICHFYRMEDEAFDAAASYFKAGLEQHERCLWVITEPLDIITAKRIITERLAKYGIRLKLGDVEIWECRNWYDDNRCLDIKKFFDSCLEKEADSLRAGFSGLRLARMGNKNDLIDFEREFTPFLRGHSIICTCFYNVNFFSSMDVVRAGFTHQTISIGTAENARRVEDENGEKTRTVLSDEFKGWRSVLDSMNEVISIHDENFKIVDINKAFADMVNMDPKDIIGRRCYEIVHGRNDPWPACPHKRAMASSSPEMGKFFEPYRNKFLEVSSEPVIRECGRPSLATHIIRDGGGVGETAAFTNFTKGEQLLLEMFHKLKNPMAVIWGCAQLMLEEKGANKDCDDLLMTIVHECARSNDMIGKTFNYCRAQNEGRTKVDLHNMLDTIIQKLKPQFAFGKIDILKKFEAPPAFADIYEKQIREVFINIINNACEAMPHGGSITISTRIDGSRIKVDFKDTGCGMSEEVLKKIKTVFFTTKEGGSGLGLYISSRSIERNGGELKHESVEGGGTTATVLLPVDLSCK